jgi:hypothetical protein
MRQRQRPFARFRPARETAANSAADSRAGLTAANAIGSGGNAIAYT